MTKKTEQEKVRRYKTILSIGLVVASVLFLNFLQRAAFYAAVDAGRFAIQEIT
jgi:hypothetical protein